MKDKIRNITSANSVVNTASSLGLIAWEGYSADNAFASDNITGVETKVGVDGKMSAGYVPTIKTLNATFEASSATLPKLLALAQLTEAAKTPQVIGFTIELPAISTRFIFSAVLTSWPPILSAQKMLEPAQFTFQFSEVAVLPM